METKLIEFLLSFDELNKESAFEIAPFIPTKHFKKGTYLVKEGEIPKECYFVLDGLIREYQIVEGEEKTTEFYTKLNGTISSSNFVNQTASNNYLVCVEDSLLICGSSDVDKANYEKFPILMKITSKMVESNLNETKDKFKNFVISSPKERYLNLLESQPDLLNRVPLHQIASYLGITAESLSRIRKRIATN